MYDEELRLLKQELNIQPTPEEIILQVLHHNEQDKSFLALVDAIVGKGGTTTFGPG